MSSLAAETALASPPLDMERFAATPLQRAPFDFLIVQAFVRPHESLDAEQNAGHLEGIRLWNENLMKARAAGKRFGAESTA